MRLEKNTVGLLLGSIVLLYSLTDIQFSLGAENVDETLRLKILEWRLPAEDEYLMIQDKFFKRRHADEKKFRSHATVLDEKKRQLAKEEQRLLQHTMDLHGFNETDFWNFQPKQGDRELQNRIMEENPEVFRRAKLYKLRSLVTARKRVITAMEAMNAEGVENIRQALQQYEAKLASFEQEGEKWQFPKPQNEPDTFAPFMLDWWELKGDFWNQYHALSPRSASYARERWTLVQWYRATLRDLMRSHRMQPLHFDQYQKRVPGFLQAYLQQHPDLGQRVNAVQTALKKYAPSLSVAQDTGMGMIVGTVIHCAVPPVQCLGDAKQAAIPVAAIDVSMWDLDDDSRQSKKLHFQTESNGQGQFVIPGVPPGDYWLSVSMPMQEQHMLDHSPAHTFFIGSHKEVLIIDLPIEQVPATRQTIPHQ